MALFLRELAPKPLDENFLRDRVDVKNYDQSNQTKNSFDHFDLENGVRSLTHCGESERDDCKTEEEYDKDRVTPDPPIALFNLPKLVP